MGCWLLAFLPNAASLPAGNAEAVGCSRCFRYARRRTPKSSGAVRCFGVRNQWLEPSCKHGFELTHRYSLATIHGGNLFLNVGSYLQRTVYDVCIIHIVRNYLHFGFCQSYSCFAGRQATAVLLIKSWVWFALFHHVCIYLGAKIERFSETSKLFPLNLCHDVKERYLFILFIYRPFSICGISSDVIFSHPLVSVVFSFFLRSLTRGLSVLLIFISICFH